ncbi:MAG: hypothetical protein LBJ67_18730 [Planctomycetaceae bacterium]|nr:hypothetical protein [Planctomycetaceae bacterium]
MLENHGNFSGSDNEPEHIPTTNNVILRVKMSISERKKEIRRRRKRREQYAHIQSKLAKMDSSAKEKLANKLRRMTPAGDDLIERWNLQ